MLFRYIYMSFFIFDLWPLIHGHINHCSESHIYDMHNMTMVAVGHHIILYCTSVVAVNYRIILYCTNMAAVCHYIITIQT